MKRFYLLFHPGILVKTICMALFFRDFNPSFIVVDPCEGGHVTLSWAGAQGDHVGN